MPEKARARQEILVVLVVAAVGLLVGVLAAFTPWYSPPGPARPVVVELHAPAGQPGGDRGTAAVAG